jgi:hypothetical protein
MLAPRFLPRGAAAVFPMLKKPPRRAAAPANADAAKSSKQYPPEVLNLMNQGAELAKPRTRELPEIGKPYPVLGFRDLARRLGKAHKTVRTSDERTAYMIALLAIAEFLKENGWNAAVTFWLCELGSALTDLNDGIVRPLLEPQGPRSKSYPSNVWRDFALVSLGIKALMTGGATREHAAHRALREVKKLQGTSIETILSRFDGFQFNRIKNREAARLFSVHLSSLMKAQTKVELEKLSSAYFSLADLPQI